MTPKTTLVGFVHMDHPSAVERERGADSRIFLSISRGLKSGRLDEVDLTRDQLLGLIETAARALRITSKEDSHE